jgi:outer membrane immunogenic protein
MMKVVIGIVAITALIGTPALAADMAVKAPPPAVAPAPIYNWTGFYLGGGLGYGMWNANEFATEIPSSLSGFAGVASQNQTWGGRGWFGTVVGGFDYQFNDRFVAGVFADADYSNIKGHFGDTNLEESGEMKQTWAWAAGGRLGYLMLPTLLSYFNVGFTQAHFDQVNLLVFGLTPSADVLPSQTYNGWFLGGGLETMLFPGWYLKTEYRFADYGSKDIQVVGTNTNYVLNSHPLVQTIRAEITYKFGAPAGAVGVGKAPVAGFIGVVKAPQPAVQNWSGLYLGGGFGYGMFNLDNSLFDPSVGHVVSANQTSGGRGWLGTVVGGFDYQFTDRFVGGVFADADFTNIKGHLQDIFGEESGEIKENWAWAVGGRIGYVVVPSVLPYLNGGFTQAHFSGGNLAAFGITPTSATFAAQTYNGWFLGGGVETMLFPGWFLRTEYRFADYGSKTIPFDIWIETVHPYVQTVRTTLTYKFNWGTPGPVVAKW